MAVLKQRLLRKNTSGGYDTIQLETSASCILMADGSTAESAINGKANSSHNHSYSNITNLDARIKEIAGSPLGLNLAPSPDPTTKFILGSQVQIYNMKWIVVNVYTTVSTRGTLNELTLMSVDTFGYTYPTQLFERCVGFYYGNLSHRHRAELFRHEDTEAYATNGSTKPYYHFPVFVPSLEELCNTNAPESYPDIPGQFGYFTGKASRVTNGDWWTCTPASSTTYYYCKADGTISTKPIDTSIVRFRPFITLMGWNYNK